jgi:hypothetical protein
MGMCGVVGGCSCGNCSSGQVCFENECLSKEEGCNEICSRVDCGTIEGCNCGACSTFGDCEKVACPDGKCKKGVSLNLTKAWHPLSGAGVRISFSLSFGSQPVDDFESAGCLEVTDGDSGQPLIAEGGLLPSLVKDEKGYTYYTLLAIDLSNSIAQNPNLVNAIVDGVKAVIEVLSPIPGPSNHRHQIAIFAFGQSSESYLVQDFTLDYELLKEKAEDLKGIAGLGSTNLYGAYRNGIEILQNAGNYSDAKAKRFMVLFSDGKHETSPEQEVLPATLNDKDDFEDDGGIIASVGLGDKAESKLEKLVTWPEYMVISNDADNLHEAFSAVSQKVDRWSYNNYAIGFCSPLEGDNRSVKLRAFYDGTTGNLVYYYDASGFTLVGCDPEKVAQPCADCPSNKTCIDEVCCCGSDQLCANGVCVESECLMCTIDECQSYYSKACAGIVECPISCIMSCSKYNYDCADDCMSLYLDETDAGDEFESLLYCLDDYCYSDCDVWWYF